ncbi:MAG TPA: ImmA/IrrE family metallo-endopeptidase [Gammaproteobacteria bacterium]|nr:ImmA/IrrE family metallo-endopeptidase [Gammaproteobacteria bacterium]
MHDTSQFQPDWAVPPGSTIAAILTERGWTDSDLAEVMKSSLEQIQGLLSGVTAIDEPIADDLNRVLGISKNFWLAREDQYRESLFRIERNSQWLSKLPTSDTMRFGWLPKVKSENSKISAWLDYFGVSSVSDWYEQYEGSHKLVAYRTSASFEADEGATLAWLRKGEIEASKIKCKPWNKESFIDALQSIRELTRKPSPSDFLPELTAQCAQSGVAVVIARAPSGCRASGATKFMNKDKALLMLSGRHKSDDHFWFTFFHEAGHLVLHNAKSLFLEGSDSISGTEEDEANQFSMNLLIPSEYQEELKHLSPNPRSILRFAKKIGVSPGIVLGQMQFARLCSHSSTLNRLKIRYDWG